MMLCQCETLEKPTVQRKIRDFLIITKNTATGEKLLSIQSGRTFEDAERKALQMLLKERVSYLMMLDRNDPRHGQEIDLVDWIMENREKANKEAKNRGRLGVRK